MSLIVSYLPPLVQIRLDRPQALNALDLKTFQQLEAVIDRISADSTIGLLQISATPGRAFSAGADINDLRDISAPEARKRAHYRRNVLQKLSQLEIPTIAVIEGFAMGGGVELALACTFRLASPEAAFSMPEIRLGLLPGAGATQRLPRLIGATRAKEMMLTARKIGAAEALSWGLITKIIETPDEVDAFIAPLLETSRSAMRGILRAVDQGLDLSLAQGLEREGQELSDLSLSADGIEGVSAFFAKRPPLFNR